MGNMVMKVDNSAAVIMMKDEAIEKAMTMVGIQAQGNAVKTINKVVYATPEKGYVRTGRLRNSIVYATNETVGSPTGTVKEGDSSPHGMAEKGSVVIGTNVEYAPYVEMGTSKMAGRPYLRPAIDNHIREYEQIIRSVLEAT